MRALKLFIAAAAIAAVGACGPSDPLVVRTKDGLVRGIEEEGTLAFKGIPYARVERFMPPLPVEKWDTVMACDHFGPQVMQGNGRREMPESVMSEKNSCVLNVWTTDTKACKPVMLWIHGGGFDSGSAAGNPGWGLAKQDVVVVSLNHRLNILGFLDLSTFGEKYRHSGMVGMLDIVQALEWIRDNIKAFGGDPSNVTIFGESGGGGKVGTLMCMPAAKGLFHKLMSLFPLTEFLTAPATSSSRTWICSVRIMRRSLRKPRTKDSPKEILLPMSSVLTQRERSRSSPQQSSKKSSIQKRFLAMESTESPNR